MTRYRKKSVVVEAVQLLWTTWTEMCEHAGVGKLTDGNGKLQGCYVDAEGHVTEDTNGRIGLKIPTLEGVMLGVEGDWIVRGVKGELYPVKPDIFALTYERDADYKPEYAPNYTKYPKLDAVIGADADVELRDLLMEARADAVRYVSDVRAEELEKARANERAKLAGAVTQAKKAIDRCEIDNDCKTVDVCEAALRRFIAEIEGTPDKRSSIADEIGGSVRSLTNEQLLQALKNVGCDLVHCDACAEVFFTGSRMHEHTCPKGR